MNGQKKNRIIFRLILFIPMLIHFAGYKIQGADDLKSTAQASETATPWYARFDSEWGGHLKLRESISFLDHDSVYRMLGEGPLWDTGINARLKNKTYWGENIYLTAHYEIQFSGGDTRKSDSRLSRQTEGATNIPILFNQSLEDDSRYLDLTKVVHERENQIMLHRMDRLSITLQPEWGTVRVGRQAVTWGNGLVFNPMDLFNPFAPTDIERDYKTGDDMLFTQVSLADTGDIQFLFLPRRDPLDGDLTWSRASAAGKIHFSAGTSEFDFMLARHYQDKIFGIGVTGFLLDAAWRIDGVWNIIGEDTDTDDYLSLIANIDYSWVWWGHNFYGFLEFYYNGLGNTDYGEAITDPVIVDRISRGNLFVLGRKYLSAGVRIELHPLVQAQVNMIRNLSDSSGIFQPQLVWDVAENFQLTAGGSFYHGGSGSEFGGFDTPGSSYRVTNADQVYILLSIYF